MIWAWHGQPGLEAVVKAVQIADDGVARPGTGWGGVECWGGVGSRAVSGQGGVLVGGEVGSQDCMQPGRRYNPGWTSGAGAESSTW